MREALAAQLAAGCAALKLPDDPQRVPQLLRYIDELLRWNQQTNLTAITAPQEIVTKHLLDCLAALPRPLPARVCDVGSGAGLPGLLWAREAPDRIVVSVDARRRKADFQAHMGRVWGLTQFTALHARVEDVSDRFDLICFRAFAALPKALDLVAHLLAPDGQVLALKGPGVETELAALDARRWRYTMTPLAVPGLDAQRCIVTVQPLSAAPREPSRPGARS